MSQAFGVPAFPVDTHIHRLMYRWGLTNGKNVQQTEKDAKRIFPEECWNDLHLQIIWYGREYSPARGWNLEKDIITRTIGRKKRAIFLTCVIKTKINSFGGSLSESYSQTDQDCPMWKYCGRYLEHIQDP